jgi:hypothetical protein
MQIPYRVRPTVDVNLATAIILCAALLLRGHSFRTWLCTHHGQYAGRAMPRMLDHVLASGRHFLAANHDDEHKNRGKDSGDDANFSC